MNLCVSCLGTDYTRCPRFIPQLMLTKDVAAREPLRIVFQHLLNARSTVIPKKYQRESREKCARGKRHRAETQSKNAGKSRNIKNPRDCSVAMK